MPLPEKPLLTFRVYIRLDEFVDIEAEKVEIYESAVPQFFRKGAIVAAFNSYEYFTQIKPE